MYIFNKYDFSDKFCMCSLNNFSIYKGCYNFHYKNEVIHNITLFVSTHYYYNFFDIVLYKNRFKKYLIFKSFSFLFLDVKILQNSII